MKILVTGSNGFIGKNLITTLENIRDGKDKSFNFDEEVIIYTYDLETPEEYLENYCKDCDFVFNLAGINRPKEEKDFMEGNYGFANKLLSTLEKLDNKASIMLSSSVQAELENPYGISKKAGEDLIFNYGERNNVEIFVYRFPNLFGKWSRPNYNSVVATFCHNIANDLPIQVNNPKAILNLAYIDDVIKELINALKGRANKVGNYCEVEKKYKVELGTIADLLYSYKESRDNLLLPNVETDTFETKLYSTYLSYLPKDKFNYDLKMNIDERGSFTEILKTVNSGQFSVNISKPGITKGEHWHHSKNEKFIVVSGKGLIQFRKIGSDEIIEYCVSGDKIKVVDIPTGYTHNIINKGRTDLITFIWCNEIFDPCKPDTYYLKVVNEETNNE